MNSERRVMVPNSISVQWEKQGLASYVDPKKLNEAIETRRQELLQETGAEVSDITSICTLLSDAGWDVDRRKQFIGQTYGIDFPKSVL